MKTFNSKTDQRLKILFEKELGENNIKIEDEFYDKICLKIFTTSINK